ncbi:DUF58 domain-containing protein [Sulfurimonas sp. HSL3-7]|uniref:DUF58 domain-containing protein n=1 Tax=Sulfonitrofixus jiaomeiensis TaxID=3131938 RepID=UPI0031F8CA5D
MSTLNKILVRARRQVFSEMIGNNPSIFHGEGYDFIELREYMPGDDIRHIDWNISAKMQTPYIKIFKEERELNIVIATMLNGSVHFGAKKFKQELIAEIVANLSYAILHNGDLLSTHIYADRLYSESRPTKKVSSVTKSVDEILQFDPINKVADYKGLAETLYKRVRRRSLILVVADFFELPDFKLLAKKHEVVAIIVRDRLEEKPPVMGFASLRDPETGVQLEGDYSQKSVDAYAKKVHAHDRTLYSTLRKDGVRFTKIYTDENSAIALRRLFEGQI